MIDISDAQLGTSIIKKLIPIIQSIREQQGVSLSSSCCRLFGISRQVFYQAVIRNEKRREVLSQIKPLVLSIRREMPRIGTRKLYYLLKQEFVGLDIKIGRDDLFNYLRSEHLLIKTKRSYTNTTNSKTKDKKIS